MAPQRAPVGLADWRCAGSRSKRARVADLHGLSRLSRKKAWHGIRISLCPSCSARLASTDTRLATHWVAGTSGVHFVRNS